MSDDNPVDLAAIRALVEKATEFCTAPCGPCDGYTCTERAGHDGDHQWTLYASGIVEALCAEVLREQARTAVCQDCYGPPSGRLTRGEPGYEDTPEGVREARDAALALVDQLAAALAKVEWTSGHYRGEATCHFCGFTNYYHHGPFCPLDAALSAAGLDTPEKRAEARRR